MISVPLALTFLGLQTLFLVQYLTMIQREMFGRFCYALVMFSAMALFFVWPGVGLILASLAITVGGFAVYIEEKNDQ